MDTVISHVFTLPTWWQLFELSWLLGLAGYAYHLYRSKGWFATPVTVGSMFWEVPLAGLLTMFLSTDFQLEGLFVILKYHYIKEVLKHDHKLRNLLIISAVVVVFIIIAL
jgi:hypothetical protein